VRYIQFGRKCTRKYNPSQFRTASSSDWKRSTVTHPDPGATTASGSRTHTERAPLTKKGRETRQRIVSTAAALIYRNGVERTTLDEVLDAARVGKSQLYHYFDGKAALVRAVIEYQTEQVLAEGGTQAMPLDSWEAWEAWCDAVVASYAATGCLGGCPIGSLSGELADHDESAREQLATAFRRWARMLQRGVETMVSTGRLRADADPVELATSVLASLEGGLLLSQAVRSERPLRVALDGAMTQLRAWAHEHGDVQAGCDCLPLARP
jgi:AcrR family transcriptional regulator